MGLRRRLLPAISRDKADGMHLLPNMRMMCNVMLFMTGSNRRDRISRTIKR